ncbi:MAG: hypothetical protein U9R43_15845 [Thermodesulfobacteriota bacterium]|nr:hypothetical protein [Thermodesulfobacteriota bacterium]
MQPTFESYEGFGAELKCPSCGFNYLYHDRIEVFDRTEDAETGLHVDVSDEKVSVDNNLNGNPSGRRHGLKIYFRCEGCSEKPVMSILQHKGNTYINFE